MQTFIAAHFAELAKEVEKDGKAAADAVDAAAGKLVAAYQERARCSHRLDTLIATINGTSRSGDVTLSRAEAVVREAERLLQKGGEISPVIRSAIVPRRDVARDAGEGADAGMSDHAELHQIVASEHGLPEGECRVPCGRHVPASATAFKSLLQEHPGEKETAPVNLYAPATAKAERQRALLDRSPDGPPTPPQPRDERGRFTGGFDGGARASVPPPPETHDSRSEPSRSFRSRGRRARAKLALGRSASVRGFARPGRLPRLRCQRTCRRFRGPSPDR